jgi:hypothetical protein
MKSDYRAVLLTLSILGLIASGILIAMHASMVDVGFLDSAPDVDEVLNSHARIMLALGVTFGSFIAWLMVGALAGRDAPVNSATYVPPAPAPSVDPLDQTEGERG